MTKLRNNDSDEKKVATGMSANELSPVSEELLTRSSHSNSDTVDDNSSTVGSPGDEGKVLSESEKNRSPSTSRSTPPELVPYCNEVHISDPNEDNSSPPHLFPEGTMTKNKLNKSLPDKTVRDVEVVDIDSSPLQNQDEVECIELDDSSEFKCDKKYVIGANLKRKSNSFYMLVGPSPLKQGKWKSTGENDDKIDEKQVLSFFLKSKIGKTRLKEREKLRKASERMRRSPRALIPKVENACSCSIHETDSGGDTNNSGTETFKTGTDIGNVAESSASVNLLDREDNKELSQKTSCTVCKKVNYMFLSQNKECVGINVTECVDRSGESADTDESRGPEARSDISGNYVNNEETLLEPTLKREHNEGNKDCRSGKESSSSMCSNDESAEPLQTLLACTIVKDMKEETKQVAQGIRNLSKIAMKDLNTTVQNTCFKEGENVFESFKSVGESRNSEVPGLRNVEDKLKVMAEGLLASCEYIKFTDSCGKNGPRWEDGKKCTMKKADVPAIGNYNIIHKSSSSYCEEKMTEIRISISDEIATYMLKKEAKKEETVAQADNAEFSDSDRMKHLCKRQKGSISECGSSESNNLEVKENKENGKCIFISEESHRKDESQKCNSTSADAKIKKCEGTSREVQNMSESDLKINPDSLNSNRKATHTVMAAGSSSGNISPDFLGESNFNGTSKSNSSQDYGRNVSNASSARMMVDSFGRDLLAGCDIAQGQPDDFDSNAYMTLGSNNWSVIEGEEEDDDDYIFTLAQRVSTGKEERDIIDGIEILSFETERDMVEFTKIQQDFYHGSSIDDGMIQSDDGLDMMDDAFALCGDVDLQYVQQAIVPTKTNDITKIKGWRNKQFAVNDNPSHYCGFSNGTYEDDDGFESCDVKIADDINMEEDQQNHWYSEDTKHIDTDMDITVKNEEATEKRSSSSPGKQKTSLVKDDVMLSSGAVFRPKAVELLKHLETSVSDTKNSKSAFVSDILDTYLSTHSQLNVSYEIPKLGAEEGITHHSEYETDKFVFSSPPRFSRTVSEKQSIPKKTGPKPKTLAEKRKMLEIEMLGAKYVRKQKKKIPLSGKQKMMKKEIVGADYSEEYKRKIPRRGRPRLRPQAEAVITPIKSPRHLESLLKPSSATPEKEDLEQKSFVLDPDYKYTWVGKRPIRITGSKLSRKPTANECITPLHITPSEMKQLTPHDPVASDVTESENKTITDTKSSDEKTEQNKSMDKTKTCEDLQQPPSDVHTGGSTKPSIYGMVVCPGVGHPLHPLAVKQLMFMRSTEVHIDKKWAEFSTAVVTSRKNINKHDQTEKHMIPIKHISPLEDVNIKTSLQKNDKISPDSERPLLNIEIPKGSKSSSSSLKIIQMSSESKLSKLRPSLRNGEISVTPETSNPELSKLKPRLKNGKSSVPPLSPKPDLSMLNQSLKNDESSVAPVSSKPELSSLNPSLKNNESSVTPVKMNIEATCIDSKNNKSDENVSSDLSFMPPDEVLLDVKNILREILDCFSNHEIENTIIQDDPDASPVTVATPKCPKKAVSKQVKNKVYRELNRLDVNVIVMGEDENGCMGKINGGAFCQQDFCRLGCICASLQTCQPSAALSGHCGNSGCMFKCSCLNKESSTNQSIINSIAGKRSLLYCTAIRLQDEGSKHLAKEEKEFRHTVIQSKNEVIVVRGGSNGGRRRREIKLPERYRDSSVVLGKEFAMAEFKMISGEDSNIAPAVSNSHSTKRAERQYIPSYVEVGVPKLSTSITKPLLRAPRVKLTLEQKLSLCCEIFKVKPCKVGIERMKGLEGVVPWCMVHLRYDCFCSGQSLKPFKRMSYRPIKRPPPIPGPPLESPATNTDTKVENVKQQRRVSRNVAVKSTSYGTNIHGHDVDRHSARTNGTTINYVLRNQSHCFKMQHEKYLQESETVSNVESTNHAPFLITQPVYKKCVLEKTSNEYVMQPDPFSLNEQEVIHNNPDPGEDNEEVGFGKIVSIMSLKPEEFERCESVDQSHEDDEASNIHMSVSTEEERTNLPERINITDENTHLTQPETESLNLDNEQQVHSEGKSHESEIFEKPSTTLIPILPEGSNDINSVRLAEIISKRDSELRSILENCIMPLNLSKSTIGSIQLINWEILLNQIENKTNLLWLQYKRGSTVKIIITGTANKPDQYCISLYDYDLDCPPDFHSKLPPLVVFLIGQLCARNRTSGVASRDINGFGLLQFDGDNWELVGSLLRNGEDVEGWCSDQTLQSHTTIQENQQQTSEIQKQYQKSIEPSQEERSGNIIKEHSCIEDQEFIKEAKFHEKSESDKITMKAVASFSPPYKNLRKCQPDTSNTQENMDEISCLLKKYEQNNDVSQPLEEQNLSTNGPILCESTGMLIELTNPLGPQVVQAEAVGSTRVNTDLTDTGRVCNESIIISDSELPSDGSSSNDGTVKNDAEHNSGTPSIHSTGKELISVPDYLSISRQKLSIQSESVSDKSDLSIIDSQGQIQNDNNLDEKIMGVSTEQKSLIPEKTKLTSNLKCTLECPLLFPTVKAPADDSLKTNYNFQNSGVEVPLPTGLVPSRWYMLNIENRFDLLHLAHSKCIIRYAQLIRAVSLANCHGKTVRVPLEKQSSKEFNRKNTHLSHDKKQTADANQPKFGVYAVPNLYTRVFIGPYGLREEAGVGAIKVINGKLVNTMYLDPQLDTSVDTDDGVTCLMETGEKEAILNRKMEQLYDSVALAPKDGRVCRGMWLYTSRSARTMGNVKAAVVSIDGDKVPMNSTRCTTAAPTTGLVADGESHTAVDKKESHNAFDKKESHITLDKNESHAAVNKNESYMVVDENESLTGVGKNESCTAVSENKSHPAVNKNESDTVVNKNESHIRVIKNESHIAVNKNEFDTAVNRTESHTSVIKNESHVAVNKNESHTPVNKNESHTAVNENESHTNELLTAVNENESHTAVNKNESHTAVNTNEVYTAVNEDESHTNELLTAVNENESHTAVNKNESHAAVNTNEVHTAVDENESHTNELLTAVTETESHTAVNKNESHTAVNTNEVHTAVDENESHTNELLTTFNENESHTAVNKNESHTVNTHEMHTAVNENELHINELQGKLFHAEIESSKSSSESGSISQSSSTDDAGAEFRRVGSRRKQTLELRTDANVTTECYSIAERKNQRKMGKEITIWEEEKQQNLKSIPQMAITESDSTTLEVVKPDSDEELLDVETPCDADTLFRETHLLLKMKANCKRAARNNNSVLEKQRNRIFNESKGATVSTTTSVYSSSSVDSRGPIEKDQFKAPTKMGPLYGPESKFLSVGKTVVSVKLVPSIPSVGYLKAVMYHNKSIMLKSPFSHLDEQAFFRNLETATKWLTDELKKKLEFIPEDLPLLWRIKHATVNIKVCQLFDRKILDGNHILTTKGVWERRIRNTVIHASNEKIRRQELFDCFHRLGSTFLSPGKLRKTNKFNILKMAITEIRKAHSKNIMLQSEAEVLRKKRITNFAKFYKKLKGLPSLEDRKREMNSLKEVFENYSEKVPIVINLDETTSADDEKIKYETPRKAKGSSHHTQNTRHYYKYDRTSSNESDADDYLTDENDLEDCWIKTEMASIEKPKISHSLQLKNEIEIDGNEKMKTPCPLQLKTEKKIVSNEKPKILQPLEMKNKMKIDCNEKTKIPYSLNQEIEKDDDFVSVSISVVRDDEPVLVASEPEDKDVVTVTRIPQSSPHEKPLKDQVSSTCKLFVCDGKGAIQSKFSASGKKIKSDKVTAILDTLQAVHTKGNTDSSEKQGDHMAKTDGFLGFPSKRGKKLNNKRTVNSGIVSILKRSSDESKGFLGFPNNRNKSEGTKNKTVPQDTILKEPEKHLVKFLHAEDTVVSDEEVDVGGPDHNLSGVCYTVAPLKRRERISISVDNERIKTSSLLGLSHVANIKDNTSVFQNIQRFKLKQQKLDLSSSRNFISVNSECNVGGSPLKKLRVFEVSRSLHNKPETDTAIQNPTSSLSALTDISRSPNVTPPGSIRLPSNANISETDINLPLSTGITEMGSISLPSSSNITGMDCISIKSSPNINETDPIRLSLNPNISKSLNITGTKTISLSSLNPNIIGTDSSVLSGISKNLNITGTKSISWPSLNSNVTGTNSVSLPSLKRNILQGRQSEFKYVVYDHNTRKMVHSDVPPDVPPGSKVEYHVVTSEQLGRNGNVPSSSITAQKTAVGQKETVTPVYVAIVSAANAHSTGTTSTISASAVKNIMAAVGSSKKHTKQIGPQITSSVGAHPGRTVHLLQPVSSRSVCVAGKKLVSVQRNNNNQYMLYNGKQLYSARGGCPIVVPASKSPSSVVTSLKSSNSTTKKDNLPLVTVPYKDSSVGRVCPPLVVSTKHLQSAEFIANPVNQTIKLKRLPPGVYPPVVPEKVRRLSVGTNTDQPKLTLTTCTTHTNSTASHALKPDVVSTTQNKPIVSLLNSNSFATTIVPKILDSSPSSNFIPAGRKISSASLENLKKSSMVCLGTVASPMPLSKMITAGMNSVESKSVNLNVLSPVSSKRLVFVDVSRLSSGRLSDIPCVSNSDSGNDVKSEKTKEVSDEQPAIADVAVTINNSVVNDKSEISKNDGTFSPRTSDEKSENESMSRVKSSDEKSEKDCTSSVKSSDEKSENESMSRVKSSDEKSEKDCMSSVKLSDEKSENESMSRVKTSDEKSEKDCTSSVKSSNKKSQNDISNVRTSRKKSQNESKSSVKSLGRRKLDKSGAATPKRCPLNALSLKSKSKVQETRNTVKRTLRASSKINKVKAAPADMMVTRSSSRRKSILYRKIS